MSRHSLPYILLCVFTFCCLSMVSNSALYAQDVVVGRVLSHKDKQPLSGAMVIAATDTARTDSLGGFILSVSAPAQHLIVMAAGYNSSIVTLRPEQEFMLTILLHPATEDAFFVDDRGKDKMIHPDSLLEVNTNDTSHFDAIQSKVSGTITAAPTGEALPGVAIYMKEEEEGSTTDESGQFNLLFNGVKQSLQITALGYKDIDTVLDTRISMRLDIRMEPLPSELGEVVVLARRKGRYRNKNNPAVMLIKQVIDHKDQNRMLSDEDAMFQSYDKMVLYVSNLPRSIKRNFLFRKFRFLFQNEDTALIQNRRLLPLYVTESMADQYWSARRQQRAAVTTAEKRMRFGSSLIESNNISSFLDRLYDQVDIYDNKIRVLNNFFLSPIAPAAPQLYKYYIVDTQIIEGAPIVQLEFEPRNKRDFLFTGRLWVSLAPDYAVTRITMGIPKGINLNWTNDLQINLGFDRQADGKYWQTQSRYLVNFGLFNSKRGAVGVRYTERSNYQTGVSIPDTVFNTRQTALEFDGDTSLRRNDTFWTAERPEPLRYHEAKAYRNVDSLVTLPAYKKLLAWAYIFSSGHVNLGSVELGSIYDIYTYNLLEGHKFRVGGRSNIKKWQKLLLEGYAAYGTRDQRFKYYAGGSFSLADKYIYGFPMHYIKVSYQSDVRAPGQDLGFATQEKVADIAKRGDRNRWIYSKLLTLLYTKELQNHMTFNLSYSNWLQEAAGNLYFTRATDITDTVKTIRTHEFSLNWRWSPNEKFYQNKRYRGYMSNGALALMLKGTLGFNQGYGPQNIPYQRLDASLTKTFFIAPLGEARFYLNAGYLWGSVPYPLLFIPQANQTYRFSVGSYNLMNFMEFASDHYVGLTLDYHMKGFILNRIPLVNRLKLREVFCFKALYGGIRRDNLPQYNKDLLLFPTDQNGQPIVNSLQQMPYIEASVGVENVLQLLRIDFVKRFTYTNLPNVAPTGIRFSFSFDY